MLTRPAMRSTFLLRSVGLVLVLAGCHEDGPNLYVVSGPTATREGDGTVRVEGALWSVVPWPAGHEFCVRAAWNAPGEPAIATSEVCSDDPVPLPDTTEAQGEWPFMLRSSQPITATGVTIDVVITTEYEDPADHYRVTIDSP